MNSDDRNLQASATLLILHYKHKLHAQFLYHILLIITKSFIPVLLTITNRSQHNEIKHCLKLLS